MRKKRILSLALASVTVLGLLSGCGGGSGGGSGYRTMPSFYDRYLFYPIL